MVSLPYHPHIQHVYPSDTYWYLQAVPEVLELAARNLDELLGGEA